MTQHGEAAGNLTGPIVESVVTSIAALVPLILMLSMLGMAVASIARVGGGNNGAFGLLDALLEWAHGLRTDTAVAGENPSLEEWRPYIAAGGVLLVAGGLFGLLLLGGIL